MAAQIIVEIDKSEKWLDKQREIAGYTVDGFTVDYPFKGKSVEVTFFKWVKPSGYENKCSYEIPTEIRSQCYMKIISKLKRCSFVDGKVIISISGQKYCIGTYEMTV
jgi:hypothetical protein